MRTQSERFGLRAETTSEGAALYIYGPIGFWGISARDVLEVLREIGDVPVLHVYMHSPGGEVFDGFAVFAQLLRHPARKVVHVDGLAGSIASVIAMAGDEVEIASVGFFYIHRPWSICIGYADDMEDEAALLRQIEPSIVSAYRPRYTGTAEELAAVMDGDGSWFGAEEAVTAGFADRVIEAKPPAAQQDLSALASVPPTVRDLWGGDDEVERPVLRFGDRHRPAAQRDLVRDAIAALGVAPAVGAEPTDTAGAELIEVAASVETIVQSLAGARAALGQRKAETVVQSLGAARRRIALARARAQGGVDL